MKFWDAPLKNDPKGTVSSSTCCVKLVLLTEHVPWNYVTSPSLQTVPSVITFLLVDLVYVLLKNCFPLASSYVTLCNHPPTHPHCV